MNALHRIICWLIGHKQDGYGILAQQGDRFTYHCARCDDFVTERL